MMIKTNEVLIGIVLFVAGVVLLSLQSPFGAFLFLYPAWLLTISAVAHGVQRGMAAARVDAIIEDAELDGLLDEEN